MLFRRNRITHVLLEITDKIKQACDSGKHTCGTFFDLTKAFDTIKYNVLLKKLIHDG